MPPKATVNLKRKRSQPETVRESASSSGSEDKEQSNSSDNSSQEDESSDEEIDEFNIEQDSESEDDDDDDKPQKKSQSEAFSTAFTSLVTSKVKAHSRDDPILVRGASRKVAKEIDKSRIEARAKRALAHERKEILDRGHQRNILPKDADQVSSALEYERKLRKVGQRGVVRLFNAVLASQARVAVASSSSKQQQDKAPIYERQKEQINEMSKQGFLDYIKAKTAADAS